MKGKIDHDGRSWMMIPDVAKVLGTTSTKVREAMGRGDLEWAQKRLGGKLIISTQSLLEYEKRLKSAKEKK
jgi:prophage antirepressor-like protein